MENIQVVKPGSCGASSDYVRKLFLIDADQVISIGEDFVDGKLAPGKIALKAGASIEEIWNYNQSITLETTTDLSSPGRLDQIKISFLLPRLQKGINKWVCERIGKMWIVIFEDYQGNIFLAGDQELPFKLLWNPAVKGSNHYSFVLTGPSYHKLYRVLPFSEDPISYE